MLVISRKQGQSLLLGRSREAIAAGEFIEIFVTEIRSGDQVKIGIEATGDVRIFRDDVFASWCEENDVIPHCQPSIPIFEAA